MSSSTNRDSAYQAKRLVTLEQLLAIQATALKPALDAASTYIAAALPADKVDTFLYDVSADALVAVGTSQTPMGQHQLELKLDRLPLAQEGRTVEVFQTGQSYQNSNVDTDLKELPGVREGLGIRSKLSVPLTIDGVRRGVVEADSAQPNAFSNDDQDFLQAIAHWIGLMIQRVELIEQRTREATAEARRIVAEENEKRWRLLVESVRDYALFTIDQHGQINTWNIGAERVIGYTAAEIIGNAFTQLFLPEDQAAGLPLQQMETAREKGRFEGEGWRVHKDGHLFWVNEIMTPLLDTEGTLLGFTKICRDLTERKQAEEALRQSHTLLEQRVQQRTQALADAHTQVQTLLHQLVTAQEEERRRIARELHDQLGQSITALHIGLATLAPEATALPSVQASLARLQQITGQLDRDVDRLTSELRPTVLDDLGLLDAVQAHVDQWTRDYGIPIELETTALNRNEIPPLQATILYRVLQEALTNVAKHAQAQHVSVVLSVHAGHLQLIVEDDGQGFEHEVAILNTYDGSKVGLAGMRERVAMAGGVLTIETAAGEGTAIYVRIPT